MARLISRQEAARLLGVEEQTISNWIASGLITAHTLKRRQYVDKETLVSHFDTFLQLEQTDKRLAAKLQEAEKREAALDRRIEEISKAEAVAPTSMPQWFIASVFSAILSVAGSDVLSKREDEILSDINNGNTIGQESQKFGLSRERILLIIHKAFRKMSAMKNYSDLRKECLELRKENLALRNQSILLSKRVGELTEAQAGRADYIKKSVPSRYQGKDGLAQLMDLFSFRLADTDLSIRTLNSLKSADVNTVGDLVQLDQRVLLRFRNFGKRCLTETIDFLDSFGLHFGMDVTAIVQENIRISHLNT